MFDLYARKIKKIIKKYMPELPKVHISEYVPDRVKKEIEKIKPEKKLNKGIISLVALGIGLAGVLTGIGVTRVVKNKKAKRVILIVGSDKLLKMPVNNSMSGYILKYTTIDYLDKTADSLCANGIEEVIVVPYTLINGYETEQIKNIMAYKRGYFKKLSIAPAILTSDSDHEYVSQILSACTKNADEDTAVVFLGKGTTHFSNSSYIALGERFKRMGRYNLFVGTATSYPGIDKVMSDIEDGHYQNVILCPLEMEMNKEFREDINLWNERFNEEGYTCGVYMRGLGGYKGIRHLVVEHTKAMM